MEVICSRGMGKADRLSSRGWPGQRGKGAAQRGTAAACSWSGREAGGHQAGETILAKRQCRHMNERMGTGREAGEVPTERECSSEAALQMQQPRENPDPLQPAAQSPYTA